MRIALLAMAALGAAACVDVRYAEAPAAVALDAKGATAVGQAEATKYFKDFVTGDPEAAIAAAPSPLPSPG